MDAALKIAIVAFFTGLGWKLWPFALPFFKKFKAVSTLFFLLICLLLIELLLVGCSLVEQKLDAEKYYRRDIQLEINGQKFDGVAVPLKAPEYEIKIKAPGKINMLTIRSCHREEFFEDPSGGLFSGGKTFTYVYKPVATIEDSKSCMLDIGAYEKLKGRHAWATVAFNSELENLPATVKCNGKKWDTNPNSSSICQARTGTLQKIKFDHRVKTAPDQAKCQVLMTDNEMDYTFPMPVGECVYYFGDQYGNYHRLISVGYDEINIRETD